MAGPSANLPESDARRPPAPRWGLGDAALAMVVGLVLSNLLAGIWLAATGEEDLSLGGILLGQLGLWTGLVGVPIFASRTKGAGSLAVDFGFLLKPIDAAWGLLTATGAQFLLLPAIALLLQPLVGQPEIEGPARELADKAQGAAVIGLVLAIAIITPIAEELYFRGLLLRAFENRVGTTWAIVLSSALFGLSHLQDVTASALVVIMVSLAAFGVLLALLTVRTGRLGPAIVAHAVFNGWTLFVVLVIQP